MAATVEKTSEVDILDRVLARHADLIERGWDEKLSQKEIAEILVDLLFGVTKELPKNKLVQVRDYDEIAAEQTGAKYKWSEKPKLVGPFKYAGQVSTMLAEGLMPEEIAKALGDAGVQNHIGPSYLRVKGLLTHIEIREFFARQMAFAIRDYLKECPLEKKGGAIVCIPNMTGGVFIGSETARQLDDIHNGDEYFVWPATPYAREMRKITEVAEKDRTFAQYVEGIAPSPEQTSALICFEELRTAAETTANATNIYLGSGYTPENGVRIIEACVFDYCHPVGIERLRRLGVDKLFLVDGKTFFEVAHEKGCITDSQLATGLEWLSEPWAFTRKVLPTIAEIYRRDAEDKSILASMDAQFNAPS